MEFLFDITAITQHLERDVARSNIKIQNNVTPLNEDIHYEND